MEKPSASDEQQSDEIVAVPPDAAPAPPAPPGAHRSERLISRLHASIQARARDLLQLAANEGIALVVTQGLRTFAEQQALYDQGRTKPGPIVTNALPGSSWHNFGLAFDVAELVGEKYHYPLSPAWWTHVGELGKSLGLEWGGDFHTFVDRPHFEYHPGLTLHDARAGRLPVA